MASTSQTLDEKWANIEKNDTILIQFQEGSNPLLPYSMEIIWRDPANPEAEYFWGTDVREQDDAYGNCITAEKFVKDLTTAATRAKKMRELRVVYYNGTDRIWPYTKVGRIIEVFTSVNGLKATLESVEDDFFGFTITFAENGAKDGDAKMKEDKPKEEKNRADADADAEANDEDDSGSDDEDDDLPKFDMTIDFSGMDRMRAAMCKMYIFSKSELMQLMESGKLDKL